MTTLSRNASIPMSEPVFVQSINDAVECIHFRDSLSVFSELINRKFVRNVCFVINRLYMEIYVKMKIF